MENHGDMLRILADTYPEAKAELHFNNPFETLIAVILSAQTTDKQVNRVTPALFERAKDAAAMAALTVQEVEDLIRTVGFYHTKARHIVQTCRILVERYEGEVPADFDELQKLPGVGRKTANVVVSNAFGQDAIAVDTHVFRVANRLGLACADDVLKTELQLRKVIPKEDWSVAHHWLIWHGRRVCHARKPDCGVCALRALCPSAPPYERQTPNVKEGLP